MMVAYQLILTLRFTTLSIRYRKHNEYLLGALADNKVKLRSGVHAEEAM